MESRVTTMESRLTTIEAIIPMLATREDLAKHETATQSAINQQTWKIIAWVTGVFAMSTATTIFIAMRIH